MTEIHDFRDDVAETLELVCAIHDRVVDAPLFPVPWVSPDPYGAPGPVRPGMTQQVALMFSSQPWADLRIEMRALDENRLELLFWMANMVGRRIVFEVCAP